MAVSSKGAIFRLFVSSTFSDLAAERTALHERVFPELRDLCLANGARFQPIDLRWGVSEEAGRDQQTMKICLAEIERCQQATPRPNFMIMLGDRYGWGPLPAEIPRDEFDGIASCLPDGAEGRRARALLRTWYRRDNNAVPPRYCLLPQSDSHVDASQWQTVEEDLRQTLRNAVRRLTLAPPARLKYFASATEQEIAAGALSVTGAATHVLCCLRSFANLPAGPGSELYLDTDPSGRLDLEAKRRLDSLKRRLRKRLGQNVLEYQARWSDGRLQPDHVDALVRDVKGRLRDLILRELEHARRASRVIDLESVTHERFADARARVGVAARPVFVGRRAALAAGRHYLSRQAAGPLMIVGESGSGKTTLMAEIARQLKARNATVVVQRFLGTTPDSSRWRTLVEGLIREIGLLYDATKPGARGGTASDDESLRRGFLECLHLATPNRPLAIFLDALDQLTGETGLADWQWLPASIPPHVHLVMSALPEALAHHFPQWEGQITLPLHGMSRAEGARLLREWASASGRTLQPFQRRDILTKFATHGLPLYLKLAFEEARHWHSYDAPAIAADGTVGLHKDTEGMIRDLLRRLASPAQHGAVLVSSSLAYIAAGRNGLVEDELTDLLSRDSAVMSDFRTRSPRSPVTDRLPHIIWSRLSYDLAPYLTERSADDTATLDFYHRQLRTVVEAEYLSGTPQRHRRLADYFEEQAITRSDGAQSVFNLRKLSELPYQLARAEEWRRFHDTLSTYEFLEAKLSARGAQPLIEDFDLLSSASGDSSIGSADRRTLFEVQAALRQAAHVFDVREADASNARQLGSQLIARLHPGRPATDRIRIGAIAARKADGGAWLSPITPSLAASRSLVRILRGHTGRVVALAALPDGRLASGGDDGCVCVWNGNSGRRDSFWKVHATYITALCSPGKDCVVSASGDGTVRVLQLQTGAQVAVLDPTGAWPTALAALPDGRILVGRANGDLHFWDPETGGTVKAPVPLKHIHAIAPLPDGRVAIADTFETAMYVDSAGKEVYENNEYIKLWDPTHASVERLVGHDEQVSSLAPTKDSRLISGSQDATVRTWLQGETWSRMFLGHTGGVNAVAELEGGRIASGSEDGTVRVWNRQTGKCERVLSLHSASIMDIATLPDGLLASASADGTIRIWNTTGDESESSQEPDAIMSLTLAGRGQVASVSNKGAVCVWSTSTGTCERTIGKHREGARVLVHTRDGHLVSAGSWQRTLYRWDLAAGEVNCRERGHSDWVYSMIPLAGGRLATGSSDEDIKVWNEATLECELTLKGHKATPIALAELSDGRLLSGSWDKTVRVWDLATGRSSIVSGPDKDFVSAMLLMSDRLLVAGRSGGAIQFWDPEALEVLDTIEAHDETVTALAALGADSFASVSLDHTVRLWYRTAAGWTHDAAFVTDSGNQAVVADPSSGILVVGDLTSRVHFLRLSSLASQ